MLGSAMRPSRSASIINADDFGFASADAVERLGRIPLQVTIDLGPFPSAARLARFSPRERGVKIRSHYRRLFARLRPLLPAGAKPVDRESRRCDCTVTARDVRGLRRHPSVQRIWLREVPGRRPRRERLKPLDWYAVFARFAIQVEGVTRGMQRYEDRIVIVRARDFRDASRRCRGEFRRYGSPYIGATNRLVRWRFEEVLDVYSIGAIDFREEPIEVYSKLRSRRLRPEHAWTSR
jgi:hypothetical protein